MLKTEDLRKQVENSIIPHPFIAQKDRNLEKNLNLNFKKPKMKVFGL